MTGLKKYSIGIGDRFARQGKAQLEAIIQASRLGIDLTPVWNKSFREHRIIGSSPQDVRHEADDAVRAKGYKGSYFVDADHINTANVDHFLQASDFFTIDVAEFIAVEPDPDQLEQFVRRHSDLCGQLEIAGLERPMRIETEDIYAAASRFLAAIQKAGQIYRYIKANKPDTGFIIEVSMDEADRPQCPSELLLILAGLADEQVPVNTIAPRFTGRFNKGVDYVGDLDRFELEFRQDVAVTRYAQGRFGLPLGLKLSIHSGSDKFSLYPVIKAVLEQFDVGVHLKTAGTTWLEEITALSQCGNEGLAIAKRIYKQALCQIDQLCGPYATVVDIDRSRLPSASQVESWSGQQFAAAIRHAPHCPDFNPNMRQLLHVSYGLAAQMGKDFLDALEANKAIIGPNVTYNLLDRHIKAVFPARP